MKEYIDKSALVTEIERRKKEWRYGSSTEAKYKREECDDILSFLDTLEVKGVDLDYIKKELDEAVRIYKPNGHFGWGTLYNVATYFYELGLKTQKEE